jgi:hypothetical protein
MSASERPKLRLVLVRILTSLSFHAITPSKVPHPSYKPFHNSLTNLAEGCLLAWTRCGNWWEDRPMPTLDVQFTEAGHKLAEMQRALAAEQWEMSKYAIELGLIGSNLPSPFALPKIELFPVAYPPR